MKTVRMEVKDGEIVVMVFDEDVLVRTIEDVLVTWVEAAIDQPGTLLILERPTQREVVYLDVDGEPVDAPLVHRVARRVDELTKN